MTRRWARGRVNPQMPLRFAVIGAGPLGTAAAYDLATHGAADEVRILDLVIGRARAAAEHINGHVGRSVAKAGIVNAAEVTGTSQVLEGLDACLSAGPARLHPRIAEAAVRAGVHFADLGGAASTVLALHDRATSAGVSLVPDCGAAPGIANLIVARGLEHMDAPHTVRVRAGDLPERQGDLPLGYQPHFAVEALAHRYFGRVEQIVDGERVQVPALDGLETVDIAPFGALEAFATPGGCDTCSATYASRLTHFDFKTLRYPGHHHALSLLADLGFLSRDAVTVDGQPVVPMRVFEAVMSRLWNQPTIPDVFALRVEVIGTHRGDPARFVATIVERADRVSGLTATQKCTGFGAGAVLAAQAAGEVTPGARPPERALSATAALGALKRRGLRIHVELEITERSSGPARLSARLGADEA